MKVPSRKKTSPQFISKIEFLRMQVAAAESAWKEAKEQLSRAKRRRKMAKLLTRRAKKHTKQAKAKLGEVRVALAQAEAKAIASARPPARAKIRKASPTAAAAKPSPSARRKARKPVRLVRAPKVPQRSESPAPILTEASIRDANSQSPQAGASAAEIQHPDLNQA